jgi:hypothetical protein
MALTNAQKQKAWRERRNALAALALSPDDTNPEMARKLVRSVGIVRAREFAKVLPRLVAPLWKRKRLWLLRRTGRGRTALRRMAHLRRKKK